MNQDKQEINLGNANFQNIFSMVRFLLLFLILMYFAFHYSSFFHKVSPADLATGLHLTNPSLKDRPDWLVSFIAVLTSPYVFRYTIAPLFAILTVLLAGAFYVKDVYALPNFGAALQYVLASMFTISFPEIKIDKGKTQLKKGQVNLIDSVGGPGAVLVEPGSAALFRHLRVPSGATVSGTRLLAPFETIAQTIDLAEQQADKDQVACMTRDGIKLALRDVHFRYRIKADLQKSGAPRPGALNPSERALEKMAFSLTVQKDGHEESWNVAVERLIVGNITDFIAEHTLDYLTAPREGDTDPRRELLDNLYQKSVSPLENLGAELLWADFGHMEIVERLVNDQRTVVWAADWIGDASVARAYGDAKRQAYRQMGRAEAQAEMIISIAEALKAANLSHNDTRENLRKILLASTAQVLDSISATVKANREGHII